MVLAMSEKTLHKGAGHRQRLRERFLTGGLDGFLDYEVIELLLTIGTPRKDCKEAAKTALSRFKTFQGVLEASVEELREIPGIGPINSFGIKLAKAVSERYLAKKVIGKDAVTNSRELFNYLNTSIRDKTRECFMVIFFGLEEPGYRHGGPLRGDLDCQQCLPPGGDQGRAPAPCGGTYFRPQPPIR